MDRSGIVREGNPQICKAAAIAAAAPTPILLLLLFKIIWHTALDVLARRRYIQDMRDATLLQQIQILGILLGAQVNGGTVTRMGTTRRRRRLDVIIIVVLVVVVVVAAAATVVKSNIKCSNQTHCWML
jgi:hypothetical protein